MCKFWVYINLRLYVNCPDFQEIHAYSKTFCKISCNKSRENSTNCLVVDLRSWMDRGRMDRRDLHI